MPHDLHRCAIRCNFSAPLAPGRPMPYGELQCRHRPEIIWAHVRPYGKPSMPLRRLAASLFALCSLSASAQEQPMRFALMANCPGSKEFLCNTNVIVAQGVIQPDTGASFRAFLQANAERIQRERVSIVVLSSPGGDLGSGMELGREIRRRDFDTAVMPYLNGELLNRQRTPVSVRDSSCASACSLAFLGGVKRFSVYWGGRIGLHQFAATRGQIGDSATQSVVALISRYVDLMGVDRAFVDIASTVPPERIHWLSKDQQVRYGVDNTQLAKPAWKLSAREDGTTVAGISSADPSSGSTCAVDVLNVGGQPVLQWRFKPGGGASDAAEAKQRFSALPISLYFDKTQPLGELRGDLWRVSPAGELTASFRLTPSAVQALLRAKQLSLNVLASMADQHLDPSCTFEIADATPMLRAATR